MRTAIALAFAAMIAGCGAQGASGTVEVAVSGEAPAVEGYPSSTGLAFADGWSLSLDFVLVSIEGFSLAHDGTALPLETDAVVIDLHEGLVQELWTLPAIGARRYAQLGYEITPPGDGARTIGVVTDAQRITMRDEGIALWMHGTARHATHGEVVLDLRIPIRVVLSDCVNGVDGSSGLVVPANGTASAELTLHLDHLFLDSIVAADPPMRFEAFAAAAGSDHVVTLDDLAAQPLADLCGMDGSALTDQDGARLVYDPGSVPLAVQDLRSFVLHQASTIGHFDGEGHCAASCFDASGAISSSCR